MSTRDVATLSTPVGEEHHHTPAEVCQDDTSTRGMVITGDKLVFSPPLYVQRYQAVQEIITSANMPPTKVVDLGSAELKFFRNLRYINGVQEVVLVDIDEETLQLCKHRVKPLMADFLVRRQEPLTVKVVCGDGRLYDPLLSGAQVVTLIEVIEHMNECDLPALVQCVFQHVRPHLVVVTTPNADFNKFFPNHTPGKFRHWDHKFEWTAEQFQHWCVGVVEEYQEYTVEFSGCGLGPDGTYCSQVATFWHHTHYQQHSHPLLRTSMTAMALGEAGHSPHSPATENIYKVIEEFQYPVDKRTKEEWEADYAMNRFNSLKDFLVSRDGSCVECSSVPMWHLPDPPLGLLSAPPDTSLAPECNHFLTPHLDNEEAIYKTHDIKNDYCFYIIDNRYAVIPIRSLAQWVNSGAETDLTDELISQLVEEECFETHGTGSSWTGKVRLYQEGGSPSSRGTGSDSGEDTSYTKWPSMDTLTHNSSDYSKDKEDSLPSDGFKNYLECWD